MKGYELLNLIRDDEKLYQVILEYVIHRSKLPQRGRKGSEERKATAMYRHFRGSVEGAKFRLLLERKLGGDIAIRVMRGGQARITSAMVLLIAEIQRSLEA